MALREYNVWSDWDRELDNMRAYNADEVDELLERIRRARDWVYATWKARGHNDGRGYQEALEKARAHLDELLAPTAPEAPAESPDDCGGEHLEDGCGCKVCREGPSA